ncbi:MAG: hypothetical protein DDG59_07385 [Anaerolineae bacterium]|nr:MAG: hypothetical protein DDG59_07385 [Anaerolineae bacterium]
MASISWIRVGRAQKPFEPPLSLRVCRTFWSRGRGFLFSPPPPPDQGLLFWYSRPSRWDTAIHMLGVSFSLAVIWLDEKRRVVDRKLARPWQVALVPQKAAQYIIECHPTRLDDFHEGEIIDFIGA